MRPNVKNHVKEIVEKKEEFESLSRTCRKVQSCISRWSTKICPTYVS